MLLWLQENAIAPFSARDILLANEIDKTNERVSDLEEAATDGREVRSFAPRAWSADQYGNGPYWRVSNNTRILPDGNLIPQYSLVYMPLNETASAGAALSLNNETKSYQLIMRDSGIYWDYTRTILNTQKLVIMVHSKYLHATVLNTRFFQKRINQKAISLSCLQALALRSSALMKMN